MSHKYLGLPLDIHGGGSDLVFPHHENEIAQSEAAYDTAFCNNWMHGGMLQIANETTGEVEKMSKSLNNFLLLHEALDIVRPEALRMLCLQTHYRSPLIFGDTRLAEADTALTRIENTVKNLDWALNNAGSAEAEAHVDAEAAAAAVERAKASFIESMDDDFNACEALGAVFSLVGDANSMVGEAALADADVAPVQALRDTIVELMDTFGINVAAEEEAGAGYPVEVVALAAEVAGYAGSDPVEAVDVLLEARTAARKAKDWGTADAVRDGLIGLGFVIEDTPQGPRVSLA